MSAQLTEHLREIRARAQKALAQRYRKRAEKYKLKLKQNLPSQIKLWNLREKRLFSVMTGSSGVSIAALLARECPDPPMEVDPDTDEESKVQDDLFENEKNTMMMMKPTTVVVIQQ